MGGYKVETTMIAVQGMTCDGCVRAVSNALKAVPGVKDVRVDLAHGQATVTHESGVTKAEHLKAAVEDAGYDVG